MLGFHNVNRLEGKVSSNLIDLYRLDCKNLLLASIMAGFHRSYGLRSEGIAMSLEIVNHVSDDTVSIQDRCVLVWNLYALIDEFVEEERLDEAMSLAIRAERNWSRDVVLGDEVGVYHVSWIEQIWHKQAEIHHLIGDRKSFTRLTDRIICSRACLFEKAEEITGESILGDRCTYTCLELMAFEARKKDPRRSEECIQAALRMRGGQLSEREKNTSHERVFAANLKSYYSIQEHPFDNISYSYCSSCRHFSAENKCDRQGHEVHRFCCCSEYVNPIQA